MAAWLSPYSWRQQHRYLELFSDNTVIYLVLLSDNTTIWRHLVTTLLYDATQ